MATGKETESKITAMLREAGIRPTPVRILVLRILSNAGRPLSALEIERGLETVDRSSITRTLASFTKERLINAISDGSSARRYEIRNDHRSLSPGDQHAHFHCRRCGVTTCLHNIMPEVPELPEGYDAENVTYVITGICPNCRKTF